MYPGTEDLLSIRDGEPVEAEARAAVDADPALQAEVARLQATRDRLRELPEFQPPPGVLAKVLSELESSPETGHSSPREPHRLPETDSAQASAVEAAPVSLAGSSLPYRLWRHAQWPLRGTIAATVAVVAVLGLRSLDEPAGTVPGAIVAEGPVTAVGASGLNGVAATYTSLASESARLERLLNEIPYRPRLVNAGTATTISGLEDRIGQVDEVLMYAGANGLQQEQTVALWQERVDLMNALLEVRYAQAQRFGF